jgi:hypothetical protein
MSRHSWGGLSCLPEHPVTASSFRNPPLPMREKTRARGDPNIQDFGPPRRLFLAPRIACPQLLHILHRVLERLSGPERRRFCRGDVNL